MASTPSADEAVVPEELRLEGPLTGWRGFLNSFWMGAILFAALVLGVIGIVSAKPFASPGVSERVSDAIGAPASCASVGATQVAGQNLTIYKCSVGLEKNRRAHCFTVSGGEVRQLGGTRRLGC